MRAIAALCVMLAVAACDFRDKDRLYEKIVTDCRLFPAGPMCAMSQNEETGALQRKVFDLWVEDVVNNPFEQDCIFAVECNGDADDHEQLLDCIGQARSLILSREPRCMQACGEAYLDCGPSECTELDIEVCHQQQKLCRRLCPPG